MGLSARQRKELREQVEASRALDYYFAVVEEQPQRSSEQQEDEAEEAEREAEMDTQMDAALGDSGKPEVHVPAAGQQQEDRAGEHLTDEDVARMRRACSFQGTDDDLRAWHAAATKRHEELRRQTNPIHPMAKGLRWGGEGMGWFDPKRARREERQYRKQKRLQKWMEREWPLITMQEDVQWSDRIHRYRTRATPPGWIFGCSEVEQGDTGAGVLPPSDWARDLCACSVLTPWAWCWACGGGEPIPMSKTLSGGELIRCQDCKTMRCTANCGCVFYNTPEVPDDRFMLFSHCD